MACTHPSTRYGRSMHRRYASHCNAFLLHLSVSHSVHTGRGCTPPRQTPQMATAANGTHPTGMHSCCDFWLSLSFTKGPSKMVTKGALYFHHNFEFFTLHGFQITLRTVSNLKFPKYQATRMHCSRMCTDRCSGCRGGGGVGVGVSAQGGGVCPGRCLPQCMRGYTPFL